MTVGRVKHLWRRGDTYYLRLSFPKPLREVVGRDEINISLRTKDKVVASTAAFAGALAFHRLCAYLRRMESISTSDARVLVREFHAQRMALTLAPSAHPEGSQARDADYVRSIAQDRITGLEGVIADDGYELPDDGGRWAMRGEAAAEVRFHVGALGNSKGFVLDQLDDDTRAVMVQGVARALLDEHRHFLHQLTDRLAHYTSPDPFFASDRPVVEQVPPGSATSLPLAEALEAYVDAKAGIAWGKKTEVEFRRVCRWITEVFGASTPIATITNKQVREWRDDVLRVRRHGKPSAPFASLLTDDPKRRLHRKTAAKYFELLASAFKWWVAEGYVASSPVGGITVKVPKSGKRPRRPFTGKELAKLFSSPMYVGCKNHLRRMEPGPHVIKDDYYWVPLIGALSGLRLGEIIQLGVKDVDAHADIPVFRVHADEEIGGTVKSAAGWRDVPVHRRLIDLGLLDFVRSRQAMKVQKRIFSAIPYGSDGSPSVEYSRWFGRRLDGLGMKQRDLTFHSLRHNFVDALREASAPEYVIKAIVGHEQSSVTDGYGKGASIGVKREWLDQVSLLDALPPS